MSAASKALQSWAALCVLCAVPFVAPLTAQGQPLNDTGVVRCIDANENWTTTCNANGHDASVGRDKLTNMAADGVAGFSFVRVCNTGALAGQGGCPAVPVLGRAPNQWGCTLDAVTGLMWEMKTSNTDLRDRRRNYTNHLPGHPAYGSAGDAAGFANAVNAAGLCGAKDWQLPTRTQLQSILYYAAGRAGPLVDANFFPNTVNWYHWTSTARGSDASQAMFIGFDNGAIYGGQRDYEYPVRLVRAATPTALPRFVVSEDGQEVTDQSTGLIWSRCVNGMVWDGLTCSGAAASSDWKAAVTSGLGSTAAWRLPNVKELSSLLVEGQDGVLIDAEAFPNTPANSFWSSTISANDRDYCWIVNFTTGHATIVTQANWDQKRRVRLVRDSTTPPVGKQP